MYEDVLLRWNPWWSKAYESPGLQRAFLPEITSLLDLRHIIAILGVRRSGKTVTLYQVIDHLINKKNVAPENIFFIKVDDLHIKTDLNYKLLDKLIEEYIVLKNPKEKIYLFFDEIQELPHWQQYLKTLYDLHDNYKIFVSGSNAGVLKRDISRYLTGRIIEKTVMPFSFHEFVTFRELSIQNKSDLLHNKTDILRLLEEYIEYGGFPEVCEQVDGNLKNEILKEYVSTIVFKDIVVKYDVSSANNVLDLAYYLITHSGNLFSFNKLAKHFGISNDTVSSYISYFEESFFLYRLFNFDFSIKKQILNPKKIYCIDTGITNAVSFKFSKNRGRLLENLVFLELKRKQKEIFFLHNKQECDFLVKDKTDITQAIQVTQLLDKDNYHREIDPLVKAMKHYKLDSALLITENQSDEIKLGSKTIFVVPVWQWLFSFA